MIIWRGFGILVFVIAIAALILTEIVSEKFTGDEQFYQQHRWLFLIGMLLAATLTYGLHRLLLLKKERVLLDEETGEEVVLPSEHSLFFIPVQLWPVVFVAFGLISALTVALETRVQPGAAANQNQQTLSE